MNHMNKAFDEVRAKETRELKANGKEPLLKGNRWCLLKRPENLTEKQVDRLAKLLKCNIKNDPSLPPQGGFPAFLEVPLSNLGWQVPR